MIIYRVENDKGQGPYNGDLGDEMREELPELVMKPPPGYDISWWLDVPNSVREQFFFGFCSKEQLSYWFAGRSRKVLATAKFGFHIAKYEIDKKLAQCTSNQCVFTKAMAKLIAKEPLYDTGQTELPF